MNKRDVDMLAVALRSSRPLVGGSVTKRTLLHEQWERDVREIARFVDGHYPHDDIDAQAFCEMCGVFVR